MASPNKNRNLNDMGAWSEEILDNDDAADFKILWDEIARPVVENCPKVGTDKFVFNLFKRLYFRGRPDFESTSVCSEVFALVALFREHGFSLEGEIRDWVIDAVNVELRQTRLKEWESPRKRKNALEKLLQEVGGERRVRESDSKATLRNYNEFADQFPRWIDVVTLPKADDDFERLYPRFLEDVGKAILARGPSMDDDHYLDFQKHHLMQFAFFVAWLAALSKDEALGLIKKAEKTKGILPLFSAGD